MLESKKSVQDKVNAAIEKLQGVLDKVMAQTNIADWAKKKLIARSLATGYRKGFGMEAAVQVHLFKTTFSVCYASLGLVSKSIQAHK